MGAKSVIISSLGLLVVSHAFATTSQITDFNQGWYVQNGQSSGTVGPTAN